MNIMTLNRKLVQSTACAVIGVILILGVLASGATPTPVSVSRMLTDSEAAQILGGMSPGACGVVVGIAIGVVVVSSSSLTLGIGGAIALSVFAHVSAYICVT